MTHPGVAFFCLALAIQKLKLTQQENLFTYFTVAVCFCGFILLLTCSCSNALVDCDGAADEMPELSDGDDDGGDDEEEWQWMEEGDTEQVNVPCLLCDRWDYATVPALEKLDYCTVSPHLFSVYLYENY